MIAALSTTLFFALTPILAHRAAQQLGSIPANFWRLVVAAFVLAAWAFGFGRGATVSTWPWFFLGGVAGFGVGGVAMFLSLPRLGSNLSTLIVQTVTTIAAALAEFWWLGTRLSFPQVGFITLTLAGVVVGLLPRSLPRTSAAQFTSGVAWAFVSALGQGVGAVLSRKAFAATAAAHAAIDPGTAAFLRVLGGIAVGGLICFLCVATRKAAWLREPHAWPWVIGNALTGPVLGVTCYQWALRDTPAALVQSIVAAAPLLTIPFALAIERAERPRSLYYLGAVMAIAGATNLVLAR